MPIIDNTSQGMQNALINALTSADSIDVEVAFFYFSGWRLLAKHLKDKKIRILVGKYIDPEAIPELLSRIKHEGENVDLDPFQPRRAELRIAELITIADSFDPMPDDHGTIDYRLDIYRSVCKFVNSGSGLNNPQ